MNGSVGKYDERNPVVARFPDRELRVLGGIMHIYNDPAGKPCGIDFVSKSIYIGPRLEADMHGGYVPTFSSYNLQAEVSDND